MPYGEPKKDLSIVLPSFKVGDFVWTWGSDCIVRDTVVHLFRESGFTGFDVCPVIIEKIKGSSRRRSKETRVPPLWEVLIRGKGGDADPESGIHLYEYQEAGEITKSYSSFRNGIIVDEVNWDGSDFFTINGYPKYILITERVKQVIIDRQLTNCEIIPSHKLEWQSGIRGEDSAQQTRTMAARPLESLLADLENDDVAFKTKIIHALGYKGDPGAVDILIKEFDEPNPSIWHSAAGSVAEIARHKQNPAHVREETFSRLCALLGHNEPRVRKSAATALGFIGTERALQEVMSLLDDSHESVRSTAVFVVGYRRYKPALEAVRRLTRDRSKRVREWARRMVDTIECEFP
ncbi:MAG TPA: HEAT repeat domain-containing protein [Desulfomonilaceae bacterium]|nr:HEAT repeat domain-containing protein [Desulfomonilaceae bacterium]